MGGLRNLGTEKSDDLGGDKKEHFPEVYGKHGINRL